MSEHKAIIFWKKESAQFDYKHYNRNHRITFEGGISIEASAAPDFMGDEDKVDPEQAFTASIASCHMLTFLAIAAKGGHVVMSYQDHAVGELGRNENNKMCMSRVILSPKIQFEAGKEPDEAKLKEMHHQAHEHCFIANSVTTEIVVVTP